MGVKTALEAEDGVEVIGDCGPDGEVVAMVERLSPDVVLMSFRWPERDPVVVCREIGERVPATKILMMSYQDWEDEMLISIMAGASGYVSQNAEGPELVRAVRMANSGGVYFDWETVQRVIDRLRNKAGPDSTTLIPDVLTDREVLILRMVGEGFDNIEIGERLNIAPATARNYVHRILGKLGLGSRLRLVSFAARRRILMKPDNPAADSSD